MNVLDYRVSLEMFDTLSQTTIKAKKGDSACKIHITLTEHGKIYKIGEGCYATFNAKKADGNFVFDTCTIENNTIVYDFLSSVDENGACQVSACEGIVDCEVTLYNADSKQLTSPRFTLFIDGTVYNGEEIVSSAELGAIEKLIEKYVDNALDNKDTFSKDLHIYGNMSMYGHKITNLADPKYGGDAVNKAYADNLLKVNDAMLFKGTLGEGGTITTVPTGSAGYKSGWTYKIITEGTYAGRFCEVGDMLICINSYAGHTNPMFVANEDWVVVQGNTTTDISYNPNSANAQSGKAIREAFENVPYPIADNEAANKVYVDNEIFYVKQDIGNINEALEAVLNGGN